mmetsp:Transcript_1183/g.2681  ORF Transcript_1183/g.2681 Transcript_1183/m.2681 type:complete len:289 (+) Transcript_1183:205-1071(+)
MSSGVVTLMFVYSPSVSLTFSPSCSTNETSSVTSKPSFSAFSNPLRNNSLRITCGVWASHNSFRFGVLSTKASDSPTACLIVALVRTASRAAPCSRASATTLSTSSFVTRGRAPSCMATIGASIFARPLLTESCRSLPPAVNFTSTSVGPTLSKWSLKTCCHSSAQTITISATSQAKNVSNECKAISKPISLMYCFGMLAPIRFPTPADNSTTPTSLPAARQIVCEFDLLPLRRRAWFDALFLPFNTANTPHRATPDAFQPSAHLVGNGRVLPCVGAGARPTRFTSAI